MGIRMSGAPLSPVDVESIQLLVMSELPVCVLLLKLSVLKHRIHSWRFSKIKYRSVKACYV